MVSLPIRDEGQALVRIRPNTHGWLTSSCHSYVGLPRLCVRAPRGPWYHQVPRAPLPDVGVTSIKET